MEDSKYIPKEKLESFLIDLLNKQVRVIECIKAVKDKYALGLKEATQLVLESNAMAEKREDFILRHQEAEKEFFEAMMEDKNLKGIQMEFTPNQTTYRIE
jgi:ribosomal protein L7/L12